MDKYKIMIVDDEEDVREGIASRINWDKLGYVVAAVAENGQDALEKAENCHLDVVLTDIKMPFMNGLDMSAHLTRINTSVSSDTFIGLRTYSSTLSLIAA